MIIEDANGKHVGDVVVAELDIAFVEIKIGQVIYTMRVEPTRFLPVGAGRIHWVGTSCGVGQPYFQFFELYNIPGQTLLKSPGIVVAEPGWSAYVPDLSASPIILTGTPLRSSESPGDCQDRTGNDPTVVPAILLIDLQQKFTPPFRYQ